MKPRNTKSAADQAARRELKKRFGDSYMPKKGVDFIVGFSYARQGWVVEFLI